MMIRATTILAALFIVFLSGATAFTASPISRPLARTTAPNPTRMFLFGPPKDDGSPGDYVCQDCGYVFTKGPKAWAALPDNYSCPPCGSMKRRFKKVPKGSANKAAEKKGWF